MHVATYRLAVESERRRWTAPANAGDHCMRDVRVAGVYDCVSRVCAFVETSRLHLSARDVQIRSVLGRMKRDLRDILRDLLAGRAAFLVTVALRLPSAIVTASFGAVRRRPAPRASGLACVPRGSAVDVPGRSHECAPWLESARSPDHRSGEAMRQDEPRPARRRVVGPRIACRSPCGRRRQRRASFSSSRHALAAEARSVHRPRRPIQKQGRRSDRPRRDGGRCAVGKRRRWQVGRRPSPIRATALLAPRRRTSACASV